MKIKLPSTLSVLYALGIAAAAWEMKTIVDKTSGNTFSATIQKLGEAQTLIPFAQGALAGHLWRDTKTRAAVVCGFFAGLFFWPLLDKEEVKS